MTSPSVQPLVFVRLLADRQKQLAALHWQVDPADATGLDAWLAEPDFAALCQQLPCLWDAPRVAAWPALTQSALAQAGTQCVPPAQVALCDSRFQPTPDATWVAGAWYLQSPSSPNSAQAASRTLTLQLLQLVNNDADTRELEEVFRRDATLSYQLLKLVNSAALRRSRDITSFAQAILLLGRVQLKRWINLLMFAARDGDERGNLLLAHVGLRARGMELLAQASGLDRAMQEQAFMTGMFSLLGVLFGTPLADLLKPLQLGEDMSAALLHNDGELGTVLRDWQAVEQAQVPQVRNALAERGIACAEFNVLQLQASQWMLSLTREGVPA